MSRTHNSCDSEIDSTNRAQFPKFSYIFIITGENKYQPYVPGAPDNVCLFPVRQATNSH